VSSVAFMHAIVKMKQYIAADRSNKQSNRCALQHSSLESRRDPIQPIRTAAEAVASNQNHGCVT
jgi:hypothetical protein